MCPNLPTIPIVTACNHLFCQSCLSHLLFQDDSTNNCSLGVCPLCRDPIGSFEELLNSVPIVLRIILQERLRLKCCFAEVGNCDFTGNYEEYENHITQCQSRYGTVDRASERSKLKRKIKGIAGRKKALLSEKLPLKECEDWYVRKRLQSVIKATDENIQEVQYDSTDVKYFLLIDELKGRDRLAEAHEIDRIWRQGELHQLNADECLALKLSFLCLIDNIWKNIDG